MRHSASHAKCKRPNPFPNNALIRQQAKELRAMELMPLEEFRKSYADYCANRRPNIRTEEPPNVRAILAAG